MLGIGLALLNRSVLTGILTGMLNICPSVNFKCPHAEHEECCAGSCVNYELEAHCYHGGKVLS